MQSLLAPQQYIIRVIDELYWAKSYAKSIRGYMYIILKLENENIMVFSFKGRFGVCQLW